MRGIAGKQHPAASKLLSHPLMHVIKRTVRNPIWLGARDNPLQDALQRFVGHELFPLGTLGGGHEHAPELGYAQQHEPLQGIGDVVHIGDVGERLLEGIVGRDDQKQFRIGETLEPDTQRSAHGAVRAVRGHHMAARDGHNGPGSTRLYLNGPVILAHRFDLMAKPYLGAGDLEIFLLQKPGELPLLALDAVGVARAAGKEREVKRRHRAGLPIAKLPGWRFEPDLDHAGYNPELVEHIEGGRVEGRSAQLQHRLALCLEHDRGDAAASERQGCSETDGASAYDDNGIRVVRHAAPLDAPG